jgi:hypothetical protein
MMEIPITLERVVKQDEDLNVITQIEMDADAKGGVVANKEMTLTELLTGYNPESAMTIKQFLENE